MKNLVLILILAVALWLRFYKINELSHFMYDEARDAFAEKSILAGKLTLLGPESRIGDKLIYFGPLHYYLMSPALTVSNYDPAGTYYFTALLGVATVLLIYFASGSLIGSAFYAVFPIAVIYNRWAWNPNTIPFFAALYILCLKKKKLLLAGIFLGLAIQLHVTAVFLIIVNLKNLLKPKFLFGIFLGLLPIIIFDLRHQGLYLHSYFNLFTGQIQDRSLTWHYFLWVLPVIAVVLVRVPKRVSVFIVSASFSAGVYWLLIQQPNQAVTFSTIKRISKVIAEDQKTRKKPFNVASFVDPVTRATAYRYFLSLAGEVPQDVDKYDSSFDLYAITYLNTETILYNRTYEISSFGPKYIGASWKVNNESIYRLEK